MKSLAKKIYYTEFVKNFVNTFKNTFYTDALWVDFSRIKEGTSISDGLIWRTDNNYKTIFKFTDIFKLFYKINDSNIELVFYNHRYNFLKKISLEKISLSNELIIDDKLLGNYQGYGIFFIFHKALNNNLIEKTILSNRCYLGFSYKNNLPSFVHGNTYIMSKNFNSNKTYFNFVTRSLFCNKKYRIQNNFKDFKKTELFFVNPTSKKIVFYINNDKFFLKGFCSKVIDLNIISEIFIKSNCSFLRPIVFSYNNNFIDVYHS